MNMHGYDWLSLKSVIIVEHSDFGVYFVSTLLFIPFQSGVHAKGRKISNIKAKCFAKKDGRFATVCQEKSCFFNFQKQPMYAGSDVFCGTFVLFGLLTCFFDVVE